MIKNLSRNQIYMWQLNWSHYTGYKNLFWKILSTEEKKRANQFLLENAYQQFVIARGALKILCGYLLKYSPKKISLCYNQCGKPSILHEPKLQFSLSHSRSIILYAFCLQRKLGVDIQYQKLSCSSFTLALAKRYFHEEESLFLSQIKEPIRDQIFFKYWTRKEALTKALGIRLDKIPKIKLLSTEKIFHTTMYDQNWLLQDLKTFKNFSASLVVQSCLPIQIHYFKDIKFFLNML